jgi:hypothetical protein
MREQDAQEPETAPARRPYEPPSVERVALRPEEAVLGSCKTGSTGGGPRAFRCRSVATCSALGS